MCIFHGDTRAGVIPLWPSILLCWQDVIELLEKRVKSRFSHRQIHLFNSQTFQDFIVIFKNLLQLDAKFPDQTFSGSWNHHIEVCPSCIKCKKIGSQSRGFILYVNLFIQPLIDSINFRFHSCVTKIYIL